MSSTSKAAGVRTPVSTVFAVPSGAMRTMCLPQVIWELVAYIQSISREPAAPWGKTTSVEGFTIEQVPAEYLTTTNPWQYTTPFSYGQAPFEKPKGSPPLETPK